MLKRNFRRISPALSLLIAIVSAAGTVLPASATRIDKFLAVQTAHCGPGASARFYQLPPKQTAAGFGNTGQAVVIQNEGGVGDVAGVAFLTPAESQGAGGFSSVIFAYQLNTGFLNTQVTFCFKETNGNTKTITEPLSSLPEGGSNIPDWAFIVITPSNLGVDNSVTLIKTVITVTKGKQTIGSFRVANGNDFAYSPVAVKFDEPGCAILQGCSLVDPIE